MLFSALYAIPLTVLAAYVREREPQIEKQGLFICVSAWLIFKEFFSVSVKQILVSPCKDYRY